MITNALILPDVESEARWRAWQARGSLADLRRAAIVRAVMTAGALALMAWLLAELGSR